MVLELYNSILLLICSKDNCYVKIRREAGADTNMVIYISSLDHKSQVKHYYRCNLELTISKWAGADPICIYMSTLDQISLVQLYYRFNLELTISK